MMKKVKYFAFALVALLFTSCIDGWSYDDPYVPGQSPYDNDTITERNVVTIAALKNMYKSTITTSNAYDEITSDIQLKAVVTGNDISGNLYNEISIQDETGAMLVEISSGGLFGQLPVGSEILINLKGLYIGNYGAQAQLGMPYKSNSSSYVSRMSKFIWDQHYKMTGETKTIAPTDFSDKSSASSKKVTWKAFEDGAKLGRINYVSIKGATEKTTWAKASAGSGYVSLTLNEYGSTVMIYTSNYSKFASEVVPQGKFNVTGIMKNFNGKCEIIIRSLDDIEVIN